MQMLRGMGVIFVLEVHIGEKSIYLQSWFGRGFQNFCEFIRVLRLADFKVTWGLKRGWTSWMKFATFQLRGGGFLLYQEKGGLCDKVMIVILPDLTLK